jgi:hypothetical protein
MNKQGIALLITMVLLGTIIATALGIAVLITGETTVTRLIDDSVFAIFAADAGAEKMLYACSGKIGYPAAPFTFTDNDLGNGASYVSEMSPNKSCNDTLVKSTGTFNNTKRAFTTVY